MSWFKTKTNSWLYSFVIHTVGAFFFIFYRHKVYGLENYPEGGAIIAANHTSFYDPPLVSCSCPEEIHFLARKTLFRNPLFGWFIRKLNSHPVSGTGSDVTTFRTILKLLQEGKKVLLFPEGTRTKGQLGKMHGGLGLLSVKSNCPVIPVYVRGADKAFGRGSKFPKLWGKTSVTFCKPIYPGDFPNMDKKQVIEQISKSFANQMAALAAISS